ncbi:MAG TPA: hypothetical protein DDZ80_21920 [Cyanobacteria bacterium UBA8803]|nr:hypothetical protein [Cyanobacteria bacterium UBA9273]HBL60989.1 hypothetical protein [Cyanobacteria bacterium UBA8803]
MQNFFPFSPCAFSLSPLPSFILTAILIGLLAACGTSTPSLGLAPGKPLVEKAIALQVSQTQQQLTQQLQSSAPQFEITQVVLKQLEPLFLGGLPTYRVQGTYSLNLKLSQQQVTQQKNAFDVYLQRQQEGKTWRLAIPQEISDSVLKSWRTYLIP